MPHASPSITVRLNGEKRSFAQDLTLLDLLVQLTIPKEKVAIELNLEIISKDQLEETVLKDGDEVEIVHFVGGGAPPPVLRRKAPQNTHTPIIFG